MQLMAQFLFLHPNKKRLVEFVSESVVTSFVKTFRNSDFKMQLSEMTNSYMSEQSLLANASNGISDVAVSTDLEVKIKADTLDAFSQF